MHCHKGPGSCSCSYAHPGKRRPVTQSWEQLERCALQTKAQRPLLCRGLPPGLPGWRRGAAGVRWAVAWTSVSTPIPRPLPLSGVRQPGIEPWCSL